MKSIHQFVTCGFYFAIHAFNHNNNNNWNLYSAISIHKMSTRLNGRAWEGVFWDTSWRPDTM